MLMSSEQLLEALRLSQASDSVELKLTIPDAARRQTVMALEIDPLGMVVTRGGEELSLTPTEYRLLLMLAENAGVVLGRERLLEEVWGYVWAGDTRLVDMHVRRLRGKVGHDVIETVRGAGYKMVRP